MKLHVRYLVILGLALLVAGPLTASTFLAMGQTELLTNSDAVIEGLVLEVESNWDKEGRVILSVATIQIENTLFGKAEGTVKVQTFGGTVNGYTIEAAGFSKFEQGDRVLLYLNQREALDKSVRVTGFQQGHYKVVDRQGTAMAVPTTEGDSLLMNRQGRPVPPAEALPLDDLRRSIQTTARELSEGSK